MNDEKKEIVEKLETLDFEGDLETTVLSLHNTIEKYHQKGFFNLRVEEEIDYYACQCGYKYFELSGTRLETDKEMAKRIAETKKRSQASKKAAKTRAIKKAEKEHKQYIKLHAIYGKD